MRCHSRTPTLLSLLFTLLHHTASSPIPDPVPAYGEQCGLIYCSTDQTCQSPGQCVTKGSVNVGTDGTWRYITSTWVETDLVTRTTTYSTLIQPTATGTTPTSSWSPPEITTTINPSGRSSGYITFSNPLSTGSFAAPDRPTESFNGGVIGGDPSGTKILTPTATGSNTYFVPAPTNTLGFGGVVGGNTGSGNLTGAQIGGIVGGVLAALFLIALILFCCCVKKGFKGFFGWLNGSPRHSTTIIHEHEHEHGRISHGGHHGSTHHHVGGGLGAGAGAGAGAGFFGGMLSRMPGRRVTTTETHTHEHHTLHGHHDSHHGGGVVHGGAGSHHFQSGHHGAIGGGGASHHRPSGHGSAGLATLLGGAAAGFVSFFTRKKHRVNEKYSSTSYSDESYTEEETGSSDSTTESSTSGSSDSSSSSSSSSR